MTDPLVYDAAGRPQTLAWLRQKYGPFVIYDPPPLQPGENPSTWFITALREKTNAPATLVVKTIGRNGAPAPAIKTAFYWPDAPADVSAGPLGAPFEDVTPARAVSGCTNGLGDVGFGMGDGAYYYPDRGERGPHAVWIHGPNTRSQLILGLGMLPGTNHDHIDVEFSLMDDDGGEEPELETEFLAIMREIADTFGRVAHALEAAINDWDWQSHPIDRETQADD